MAQASLRFHRQLSCPGLLVLLALLSCLAVLAQGQTAVLPPTPVDVDPALHAVCGKDVVLLGESPTHGFGATLEYKAELVRRLILECRFNAVFFESGTYDFIHIESMRRAGYNPSDAAISAAIGGLWANQEVQSLVPILREHVNAGALTLGGLDDQLGAGSYASKQMPADLVKALPTEERADCLSTLQRHTLWQYTSEAPYGPADKQKILACLASVKAHLSYAQEDTMSANAVRAMVESLERSLARDFTEDDFSRKDQVLKWTNDREQSMYLNFEWLARQLPPHSKIIVWAATLHTAKSLNQIEGLQGRISLGSYIQRDYGKKSFSLGFSALSGDFSFTHHPVQHLSESPAASVEAQGLAHSGTSALYLSREQLRKLKFVPSRALGTQFTSAHWDQVFDGMVIFRTEHPPTWFTAKPGR